MDFPKKSEYLLIRGRHALKNKTILIVEDNWLNLKLAASVLNMEDYNVLEAKNAEEGIKLAREKKPDLILMDIQLPDMDGMSATKIIKNDPELEGIPVVALTAHAMSDDKERFMAAGCDGYITKPIDTIYFAKTVSGYLKENINESDFHFADRTGRID